MKLRSSHSNLNLGRRAFTLVEALIVSVTLVVVVGSVIACNLFGLSMAMRQQIWLSASDDSAQAVGTMMTDIRSSFTFHVGTVTNGVFTAASSTALQAGTALMLYMTTNDGAVPWTMYYYDKTSNNLIRSNYYGPSSNADVRLLSANPITNDTTHPIFTETDYTGTAVSNSSPAHPAVQIYLSFVKLQDPQVVIQNGSSVDLYQIITTVTPRTRL